MGSLSLTIRLHHVFDSHKDPEQLLARRLLQGMMMILQNHYQRRRMYTRIALGKNKAMDVVSGESSGGTGQLVVLYPLLFGLQGFQCLIGTVKPQKSQLFSITLLH